MEFSQGVTPDRFKCVCGGYINADHPAVLYKDKKKTKPICPDCGLQMTKMCPEDRECHCALTLHAGVVYCPECGMPTCVCGSHDVAVWTRVTGYLQSLEGFNAAKKQEVKDRQRYEPVAGKQVYGTAVSYLRQKV
jgi:hypothetical protein